MRKILNNRTPALNGLRKGTSAARRVLRGLLAPVPPARPVAITSAPVVAQTVPDPAGLLTADEMPPLAVIEADIERFLNATEQARAADRTKRAAKKLLDRLPAGRYGLFAVERIESPREIVDLDAVRRLFAANNLGELPMRRTAASLKVAFAPELAEVTL